MPLLLCACMACHKKKFTGFSGKKRSGNLLSWTCGQNEWCYTFNAQWVMLHFYCNRVLIWCTLFHSVQSVSCYSTSEQGASTKQHQQTWSPDLSPSFSHYLSPHLCSPPACAWPSSMLSCKFQFKACFSMAEAFFFSVCPTHFQLCSGSECHWFLFIMSLSSFQIMPAKISETFSQGTCLYMSAASLWFTL